MMKRPILVLGAGIQGICAALALRAHGYSVKVFDQMPDLMLRASLRNEGKLHLGFVYANDASFQTSALLLRAALNFGPLLQDWLGIPVDWRAMSSTPFLYLVMRDSMLAPSAIRAHYEHMQNYLDELVAAGERVCYFGTDLVNRPLWQSAPTEMQRWFASEQLADTIQTPEVAVERHALRNLIRGHLASLPEITTHFGHTIKSIERTASGYFLEGTRADGSVWNESAEIVINCLWDGRLALDHQLGFVAARSCVMRLKYRVLVELPPELDGLPSMTMVLGRFGDVVKYPNAPTYLSWYPACLRGWSSAIIPPEEWNRVCAGNPPPEMAEMVARETLEAFEELIPDIGSSRVHTVDGGVICSWGETDIDDPVSALHKRYEIGFTQHDGYYSVDTGKFTCAPLFAQQIVEHLSGH